MHRQAEREREREREREGGRDASSSPSMSSTVSPGSVKVSLALGARDRDISRLTLSRVDDGVKRTSQLSNQLGAALLLRRKAAASVSTPMVLIITCSF